MRLFLATLGAIAVTVGACTPMVNQSNGSKMAAAGGFAAAAAVAQVVESVAEQNARNNAPVTHASSLGAPPCDNDGQYPCTTVAAWPSERPDPPMTDEEARDYVRDYVDGVRKVNGVAPVDRDSQLDTFAQDGSDELAHDHKAGQHLADHAREIPAGSGEVQGSPDGLGAGTLEDQLAQALLGMMNEGAGGTHHDILLQPAWKRLGVGIVERDGRTYLTADFAP
jgi:uncharacterized protein YkwD